MPKLSVESVKAKLNRRKLNVYGTTNAIGHPFSDDLYESDVGFQRADTEMNAISQTKLKVDSCIESLSSSSSSSLFRPHIKERQPRPKKEKQVRSKMHMDVKNESADIGAKVFIMNEEAVQNNIYGVNDEKDLGEHSKKMEGKGKRVMRPKIRGKAISTSILPPVNTSISDLKHSAVIENTFSQHLSKVFKDLHERKCNLQELKSKQGTLNSTTIHANSIISMPVHLNHITTAIDYYKQKSKIDDTLSGINIAVEEKKILQLEREIKYFMRTWMAICLRDARLLSIIQSNLSPKEKTEDGIILPIFFDPFNYQPQDLVRLAEQSESFYMLRSLINDHIFNMKRNIVLHQWIKKSSHIGIQGSAMNICNQKKRKWWTLSTPPTMAKHEFIHMFLTKFAPNRMESYKTILQYVQSRTQTQQDTNVSVVAPIMTSETDKSKESSSIEEQSINANNKGSSSSNSSSSCVSVNDRIEKVAKNILEKGITNSNVNENSCPQCNSQLVLLPGQSEYVCTICSLYFSFTDITQNAAQTSMQLMLNDEQESKKPKKAAIVILETLSLLEGYHHEFSATPLTHFTIPEDVLIHIKQIWESFPDSISELYMSDLENVEEGPRTANQKNIKTMSVPWLCHMLKQYGKEKYLDKRYVILHKLGYGQECPKAYTPRERSSIQNTFQSIQPTLRRIVTRNIDKISELRKNMLSTEFLVIHLSDLLGYNDVHICPNRSKIREYYVRHIISPHQYKISKEIWDQILEEHGFIF